MSLIRRQQVAFNRIVQCASLLFESGFDRARINLGKLRLSAIEVGVEQTEG